MKSISKKLVVVTAAALLSMSAMADAQAGQRGGHGYRGGDHRHAPVARHHYRKHARAKHRHGYRHGYRHGPRHGYRGHPPHARHRYVRRYAGYSPGYYAGPVSGRGATIWIDGVGFSIYDSH